MATASCVSGQASASYSYDANGNRTSGDGSTYGTPDHNHITDDGTSTYHYDDEGNRDRKGGLPRCVGFRACCAGVFLFRRLRRCV